MKISSSRFDLTNGKYLSIFLGAFARIAKVTHFAQVTNFCERAYRNGTQSQLNNEGAGELHEMKQSRGKMEIGKEI